MLAYQDWIHASEIRRKASVIGKTGWTIEQYVEQPRDEVDELLTAWSLEAGLAEGARANS